MKIWKSEMLAISRAGHDKDEIYVIVEDDGVYYRLCDGKHRLLESPKKKKHMHVQIIRHLPENLLAQMEEIRDDADVRRILKEYRKTLEARK